MAIIVVMVMPHVTKIVIRPKGVGKRCGVCSDSGDYIT